MAGIGPPPPGLDLTEDKGPGVLAAAATTWALAVTVVGLRIVSRSMRDLNLWIDDWLILVSVIPASSILAMTIYVVKHGLGKHIWAAQPDSLYAWALTFFVAELSYFVLLMCVKWSILAFYWRSFNVSESIKIPIWILAVVILLWGVAVILVTIFTCSPINTWWDRFNPVHPLLPSEYTCSVDSIKFFYGNAIPTILTDIMMLALPTPYILKLQLPSSQKVALVGVFLVGLFVTVVSAVRLYYLVNGNLQSPDVTWNFVDIGVWSVCEANVAIICACLPFLRPVLSKITGGVLSLSSLSSRREHQSADSGKSSTNQKGSLRTWEGDGRHGTSSAHVRAFSRGATGQTDEHPFVHLTDDGSNRSLSMKKPESVQIELREVHDSSDGRASPVDGIVVTKEVRMKHQEV